MRFFKNSEIYQNSEIFVNSEIFENSSIFEIFQNFEIFEKFPIGIFFDRFFHEIFFSVKDFIFSDDTPRGGRFPGRQEA